MSINEMTDEPVESMEKVIRDDGRYPPEAYAFLHEGLSAAVQREFGQDRDVEGESHVTGQQICHALRELAVERWGMLARAVLRRWNIRSTIDFGNMVYLLIRHKFMKKTPTDSIEDFRDVYDFDDALDIEEEFDIRS